MCPIEFIEDYRTEGMDSQNFTDLINAIEQKLHIHSVRIYSSGQNLQQSHLQYGQDPSELLKSGQVLEKRNGKGLVTG